MSSLEDDRVFDAYAHQVCNGKESPIVDALVDVLPVGKFVVLLIEQTLQVTNAGRIVLIPIECAQVIFDEVCDLFVASHQRPQTVARRLKAQSPIGGRVAGASISIR